MKRYITQLIFISSLLCIITTGCLKDDDFDNGSIQSVHTTGSTVKPIEIKLTAADATNFFVLAVDNSNNDTTVDLVPINLATADAAPEDIHVTVALDSNLVLVYDTTGTAAGTPGGDYQIPTSTMYTIINPEVIIPKGSHTGYLQIKFKPSDFIGGEWALGFKIASIKEAGYTISGNLNTGVTSIAVKNQYDGVYNAVGYFTHPVYFGDYNTEWICATSGPSSITFQLNVTVLFGVNITLTVNADNSVDISTDDAVLDAYDHTKNYYSPADRTFHLDFGYSGGTRHLTGTATYKHAR